MELRAEAVSRQYFRKGKGTNVFNAVEGISLTLKPGTLTEIAGRSGSGKSTLLNMMGGLLAPTSGRIMLDETDLYSLADTELAKIRNRKIGIVQQGQTALRALTVAENVLLPAQIYGTEVQDPGRVDQLLEEVEIAHLRDVYPDELSGGERRRLVVARALMMQPSILLADEPTADLDDENTANILRLLRRCADDGMAVMLVTHEPEAAAYADVVCRMHQGHLEQMNQEN